MIYEYAVDPELVKDWILNRDVGLAGYFGMDQRRIVSDVDGDWQTEIFNLVFRHFGEDYYSPEFTEANQFLQALMQFMYQGVNRGLHRSEPWIDQVLQVNQLEPFHAILTTRLIPGCNAVITPDVTRDLTNSRWYLPSIKVTKKTAAAIADQLATLLRLASTVVLIDYYFDPLKDEYCEVLAALIAKAVLTRAPNRTWPNVVVISSVDYRNKSSESRAIPPAEQHLRIAQLRCNAAIKKLGACAPIGMSITFKCVAAFKDGDEVHNRYLLTDLGGACIPYGLDLKGENVFDDITPLYQDQFEKRWKQYYKAESLNVIGQPVVIQGQLE